MHTQTTCDNPNVTLPCFCCGRSSISIYCFTQSSFAIFELIYTHSIDSPRCYWNAASDNLVVQWIFVLFFAKTKSGRCSEWVMKHGRLTINGHAEWHKHQHNTNFFFFCYCKTQNFGHTRSRRRTDASNKAQFRMYFLKTSHWMAQVLLIFGSVIK